MNGIILLLASIATLAQVNADAETAGARSCPGGYRHEETYDSGRYWYECKDGQAIPRGCLAENGRRFEVQETFDTQDHRMQCVLDADGYLAILYKSCMFQGQERELNERFDDGKVWYTCKKDGSTVRRSAIGCVEESQQILFGERVTKDEFVYTCKKGGQGTRAEMAISGCYHDGRKYTFGETYDSDRFTYTCTDKGGKIVGCFHNGQRLKSSDSLHENDILWKCKVDDQKTAMVARGCIQLENGVEIEKKFDCYWVEGEAPTSQYEMTCKHDPEKNTALKIQLRCQYQGPEGTFRADPGCYVKVNDMFVGCEKDESSGRLQTRIFNQEKPDPSTGLRQC
jgi:hypothetical protein